MNPLTALNRRFTTWLTAPVPNAVGSLGIYRIIYCFFYLQYAAEGSLAGIASIPNDQWRPVPMLAWLNEIPSAPALELAYILLVVGLFMTLIGFYTRPATLIVLLAGTFLSATRYSFNNMSHGDQYMVMYVPFFMMLVNWGKAYSVDALIQRKQGRGYDVHDGTWQHSWAYNAILLLLSVMFVMSAFIKVFYGEWLREFHLISDIIYAANLGANPNPFHSIIANTSVLYVPLEITAFLLEGTFFLILFGLNWRRFYLSTAVFFHVFNRNFVGPSTYWMVVVYGLFINWQLYLDRTGLMQRLKFQRFVDQPSVTGIRIAAIVFVLIATLSIQTPLVSDGIFNGLWVLQWVWWIATPIAAIGLGEALRQLWGYLTRTLQPTADDGGIPHVLVKWIVAAVFLAVAWWLLRNTPRTEVYGNWWEFALLLIAVYLAILMPLIVGTWLDNRRQVHIKHAVFIIPIIAPLLLAAGWEVEAIRENISRPFNRRVFPIYEARFPQLPPVQVAALTDLKGQRGVIFDPTNQYPDLKNRLNNIWTQADIPEDRQETLQRWYERRYPGSLEELDIDYLLVDRGWLATNDEAQRAILLNEEHYALIDEWEAGGEGIQLYAVVGEQYAPDHPFYDGRLVGTNRCVIYPHGDRLEVYTLEGSSGVLAAHITADDLEGEGVIIRNEADTVTISYAADGSIQIACANETGREVHILADLAGTIIDQRTENP